MIASLEKGQVRLRESALAGNITISLYILKRFHASEILKDFQVLFVDITRESRKAQNLLMTNSSFYLFMGATFPRGIYVWTEYMPLSYDIEITDYNDFIASCKRQLGNLY